MAGKSALLTLGPCTMLRGAMKVLCGCIWTPPDCNGLFGSGSAVAIADVYPASSGGLTDQRREPRWISACFYLIAPKASVLTLPIHTSGSRSNGRDPFPSLGRCCNIPVGASSSNCSWSSERDDVLRAVTLFP